MSASTWIIVAMLLLSPNVYANGATITIQQQYVGVITNIKGKVYIWDNKKAPRNELTEKNGVGKQLRAGQLLQCPKGAYLRIKLSSSDKEKEIRPGAKYLVPNTPRSDSILDLYFRRAGRRRSPDLIFSPSDEGVVYPDTLVFRWNRLRKQALSLSLRVRGSDLPFWVEDGVDGMTGRFSSESARAALKLLRRRSPDAQVEFTIAAQDGSGHTVVFSLLSFESEKLLGQELTLWDQETDFLRHLGRAYSFSRRQLYAEAAEEYEALLTTSPESIDLLIATVEAHRRAGNTTREDELLKRLPYDLSIQDR